MNSYENLDWVLLAIASVCLWIQPGWRGPAYKLTSLTSPVIVFIILFPLISLGDDLSSILNSNESILAEAGFECGSLAAPLSSPPLTVENSTLDSMHNRPPPAA